MWGVWVAVVIAVLGVALWWWQRGGGGARPSSRASQAARWRQKLVARVKDPAVADRLAEGELERRPDADMATCYRRALERLERERG